MLYRVSVLRVSISNSRGGEEKEREQARYPVICSKGASGYVYHDQGRTMSKHSIAEKVRKTYRRSIEG